MKLDTNIQELFKRYLEGQTTPAEEKALFSFINEHKDSENYFQDIISAAWNKDMGQEHPVEESIPAKKLKPYTWLKYAASLILICSAALGWYLLQQETPRPKVSLISKSTQKGQKLKLLLPDSSIVYLNALSKLSFPAHFEPGKNREIHLEGEAFFEVKHDTSRPFIVHSGHMQTRVLGTSFNINAYPNEGTFNVAVRTGKVAVSIADKESLKTLSLLTPGKHLAYHLASKKYNIDTQKAADFNSWTSNRFIFKNETLAAILKSLQRSYLVDFKVKSTSLLSCRFNATFANKNIKEIADQLQTMSGGSIHYKFNQDKTIITLWGEACQ